MQTQDLKVLSLKASNDFGSLESSYQPLVNAFLKGFNQTLLVLGENSQENMALLNELIFDSKNRDQRICVSLFTLNHDTKRFYFLDLNKDVPFLIRINRFSFLISEILL